MASFTGHLPKPSSGMSFLFISCFIYITLSADAKTDPDLQRLQNQIISLEGLVQQIGDEFIYLRQQHANLEQKYHTIWDELRTMRFNNAVEQNKSQPIQSRSATETIQYTRRSSSNGQKGDKGDIGERGPKGDPGISGFNGDDGFDGQKGMKGDQGSMGNNGSMGAKGDTGSRGAPGPTGHIGPKGDRGSKGEPGQQQSGTKVAFSVTSVDTTTLENGSPTVLVFDHVNSNIGDDYDPITGMFTCATPGTYVITWTTEVKENTSVRSYLTKNGRTILFLSVASPAISPSSGSQTVILHLDIHDVLYIEAQSISADLGAVVRSSFAAFLLY